METAGPEPRSEASEAAPREALAGADLAALFLEAPDLDSLERRVLALAVHPGGLGARHAWLLFWNESRGQLAAVRGAAAAAEPGELLAAPVTPAEPLPPGDPLLLHSLMERAWSRGLPGAGAGSSAIAADGVLGAMPLRAGLRPYGLLVATFGAGADPGAIEAALTRLHRIYTTAAAQLERVHAARRRERHSEAVREFARLSAGSINLAEALRLAVRVAAHATGARGTALWLGDPGALRIEATHGPAGRREGIARGLALVAEETAARMRPLTVGRGDPEAGALEGEARQIGEAVLVPLIARGRLRGVLAAYDRAALHPAMGTGFDPPDGEFLSTLADLVAAVVDEAERSDGLRQLERRTTELKTLVARLERRAESDEHGAARLREARGPLASIISFARRMQRGFDSDPAHPHREFLEIVVREAERLERSLAEPAPSAEWDSMLRVESVNAAIQEVLHEAAERLVRRRIRLIKRLAPDLPALLMEPAGLRRALRNVAAQALDRVAVGGRMRIESRRAPHHVVIEIAHDGPRRPGELIEELFAPFGERPGGAEPVLALARGIVREHGGEVRLRSEGEWSSIVTLTLPITENRDRRGADPDRRAARSDRRGRAAPAGG